MFTANTLLPWFVLLLPLASAAVITLFTRRWKDISSAISVAAVLGSFICSCAIFNRIDISAPEFGWIDIRGLLPRQNDGNTVPNGIAYDAEHDRLFVTGKNWPRLFEIKLT